MWRFAGALVAFAAVVATIPSVGQAAFPGHDARMYTLLRSDRLPPAPGPRGVGWLRGLPDGSVLFTRFATEKNQWGEWEDNRWGELWQLRFDGRVERLGWAGTVRAVTTAPDGKVFILRVGTTLIERLDLAARRRYAVADVADVPGVRRLSSRRHASILALGDGSIITAYRRRIWRIPKKGPAVRLPSAEKPFALVALGPADFAFETRLGRVFRMDANGTPRQVVRGFTAAARPEAPAEAAATTPDGRILVTSGGGAVGPRALTVVDSDGTRHRHSWKLPGTLGGDDGRTLDEVAWPSPVSMTVTGDGSLVLATADAQIRALIPPESRRPRIVVSPATYDTVPRGAVSYQASRRGTVTAELRRGKRTVARTEQFMPAGVGRLSFRTPPPPGRYQLRLTLGPKRIFAQTREIVDFRAVVPIKEAATAVKAYATLYNLGSFGSCSRRGSRTFACSTLGEFVSSAACKTGWLPSQVVLVELRPDGRFNSRSEPATATRGAPGLRLMVPRRTRLGSPPSLRARVTAPEGGRATVQANIIFYSGDAGPDLYLKAISRTLSPGQTWAVDLPIPRAHIGLVRRHLRLNGAHSIGADFFVNVDINAGPGPARCAKMAGTEFTP